MESVTTLKCINCGMRCEIEVTHDEESIYKIEGNNCKRGENYAIKSLDLKKRILPTVLLVENGKYHGVNVESKEPIKLEDIPGIISKLRNIKIQAPLKKNQVVHVEGIDFIILENVDLK